MTTFYLKCDIRFFYSLLKILGPSLVEKLAFNQRILWPWIQILKSLNFRISGPRKNGIQTKIKNHHEVIKKRW